MRRLIIAFLTGAIGLIAIAYLVLRGSLPDLDGSVHVAGLTAPVTIERDALGVPTVRGQDRLDVARATGFLHAQDRFFQMDLQRRAAAGELSALLGRAAVELDKRRRVHRLRQTARKTMTEISTGEQQLLNAYTEGVNAGLRALPVRPPEYLVLQAEPELWQAEDTILVNLAMYFRLNDFTADRDATYAQLHDGLPVEMHRFVTTPGTEWDAPLVGDVIAVPPIPGEDVCNLRSNAGQPVAVRREFELRPRLTEAPLAGSNAWSVAGHMTATGRAIVANDMHLELRTPNIWYRMRLIVDAPTQPAERLDVAGVTLPGAPVVVAGSNGSVAWGFTNTYGDWSDLVLLELDPDDENAYRTSDGFRPFQFYTEQIAVRGAAPVSHTFHWTRWGPVMGKDHQGRLRALHWLAHKSAASNLRIVNFERARNVREAVRLAHTVGAPPQNLVVADINGDIAWTIMGRLPVRVGYDLRLPSNWSDGTTGWDGWLASEDYPVIINPSSGFIWTANARTVEGALLERIGDGGFVLGARAGQIRDALLALKKATLTDMLRIQLDDRDSVHERWQSLLVSALTPAVLEKDSRRAELRTAVENWDGHASIDSVGYRMVRQFRRLVQKILLAELLDGCGDFDKPVILRRMYQMEGPLWRLIADRPPHLLPAGYPSWEALLVSAADAALATCGHDVLGDCTWGEINFVEIRHPLSNSLPFLSDWLDIFRGPLPGDVYTPRVQRGTHGASERFAVSPGDEANGYFHMPGGQSGHPLSPFYRAGHDAWVRGEPLPFLPGPMQHELVLAQAR